MSCACAYLYLYYKAEFCDFLAQCMLYLKAQFLWKVFKEKIFTLRKSKPIRVAGVNFFFQTERRLLGQRVLNILTHRYYIKACLTFIYPYQI